MATKEKGHARSQASDGGGDDLSYRTYLVRVGLLARGMLLRGRTIAFNKMVNEIKKGEPAEDIQAAMIKDIHPAMPSSEQQFWLLADTARHLESCFSVMFLELLSGIPVKSVEVAVHVVQPPSVLNVYHQYVQHNPIHRVYKITLPSSQWVLDPGGARFAYEDILLPWKAFKLWKCQNLKEVSTLNPDLATYEKAMGMCSHAPAPNKNAESKGENPAEEESVERLALRMWTNSWASLLPELFGGSMSNIGSMSHERFSVAMDEFLAVVEAYVRTYLLDTDFYTSMEQDHSRCLSWAKKMHNGHPERCHDSGSCGDKDCLECYSNCHEALFRAMRQAGLRSETRWEYSKRVEKVTGRKAGDLSKEELLKTVERLLVDRAGDLM